MLLRTPGSSYRPILPGPGQRFNVLLCGHPCLCEQLVRDFEAGSRRTDLLFSHTVLPDRAVVLAQNTRLADLAEPSTVDES